MKVLEKSKAVELRRRGKTYSEILSLLEVSKGSLNTWLRHIELSDEQISRIKYKNEKIKRKFIKYNILKRKTALAKRNAIRDCAFKEIDCISQRELKLVGVALYWAEGTKPSGWNAVAFANSDPSMIVLMMRWFREICGVPEDKFRLKVQAYGKSKIKEHEHFWSKLAGIPLKQFVKPYVKESKYSKLRRVTHFRMERSI